ncbi:pyrroline-5-carboxylate reductase [Limoniibacter endophyticus]|uniref:Pyrroline-5-carboxylate reductase n=1 Tax=Limoniibacter endophyticus TaxID=1565040 RepID=A0A8J3DHL7_9HYPH|nr:pyrroline-5-carboxylate reductase [Limoniibacter endophyticus]GHC67585.1 pyrroline-5-carboxylate reductase [Limoniibacter endophyticus]
MSNEIILVGAGHMGYAMLEGWLGAEILKPEQVVVVEPAEALRDRVEEHGCAAVSSAADLGDDLKPQIIVLAIKPQMMNDILPDYKRFGAAETTFLSVAAGTSIATIEGHTGPSPVIRVMPNTPSAIGEGMLGVFANERVSDETMQFVDQLLVTSGDVVHVEREEQIDAITAISGSGPGYVFHFIEALTEAAKAVGFEEDTALLLAKQTIYGSACLAMESENSPTELRKQVTSPNGTTAAALAVLMEGDAMTKLVTRAVTAARDRAVELGK